MIERQDMATRAPFRIGVWNLKLAPNPDWPRGQQMLALARECNADFWLFTEVHAEWALPGYTALTSEPRSGAPERKRWSGVACRDRLRLTPEPLRDPGPADEGLCLARITDPGHGLPDLLVACSVLPWANTTSSWPSLHAPDHLDGLAARFRYVTASHVERIASVRRANDVVIWGGDFNQSLTGRVTGSRAGWSTLLAAFDDLALDPLTADARHLSDGAFSIDHLAVSSDWPEASSVTVIAREDDPRQTSDHALYLIDIEPRSLVESAS